MAFPNGDWTTRDKCIEDYENSLVVAQLSYEDWSAQASSTVAAINAISDATVQNACKKIYTQSLYNHKGIKYILNYWPAHDVDFNVPYFFKYYTPESQAEITWKTIVSAWIDADLTGRLWTIATIDELRKEVWNEPFEGLWIKAGKKPT